MTKFSNRCISITSRGKEDFVKAMSFFMDDKDVVTYFSVDEKHGLVLYWPHDVKGPGIQKLPYVMSAQAACDFAWNWLQTAEYKHEPDHDGDNEKGWNVYNESWTHVAERWEGLVGIRPVWAMYGK